MQKKFLKKLMNFSKRVLEVVRVIPAGKALTYKEVARRAGRPKACRAVGNILAKNFDPKIPCHRVIRSDGKPGGYNRGRRTKRSLLTREGVKVKNI
jgi:O-6-methylguanine DNA methyltransferase